MCVNAQVGTGLIPRWAGRGGAGGRFGTFRKEEETLEGYGRPPYVVRVRR